jgi:hypothetical protein
MKAAVCHEFGRPLVLADVPQTDVAQAIRSA